MKTKQCPNPPPEEPPQPWHLAHGQVVLAGDVEVSDAQEAIAAQVGARSVHGIVEGWDHCGGRAGETRGSGHVVMCSCEGHGLVI